MVTWQVRVVLGSCCRMHLQLYPNLYFSYVIQIPFHVRPIGNRLSWCFCLHFMLNFILWTAIITVVWSVSSVPPCYCGTLRLKITERDLIILTFCHKIDVRLVIEVPRAVEALVRHWAGEELIRSWRSVKILMTVFRWNETNRRVQGSFWNEGASKKFLSP